jgi:hypothetical protein
MTSQLRLQNRTALAQVLETNGERLVTLRGGQYPDTPFLWWREATLVGKRGATRKVRGEGPTKDEAEAAMILAMGSAGQVSPTSLKLPF